MVPNLVPGLVCLVCLVLAGCAGSPSSTDSTSGTVEQKKQAEAYGALASFHRQQGHNDQAMAAYRKAFELDPNDAVSANNLALFLREQGRFQEAAQLLQEGIQHSPDTADLHYNLAVIAELYLLDLELALAHYRKYRELTDQKDEPEGQQVAGWIADLERRLD